MSISNTTLLGASWGGLQNSGTARTYQFQGVNSTAVALQTNSTSAEWDDKQNRYHRGVLVTVNISDVYTGSTGEFVVSISQADTMVDSLVYKFATMPNITAVGKYWMVMHPDVKAESNNHKYGHLPRTWGIHYKATGDRKFDGSINIEYLL